MKIIQNFNTSAIKRVTHTRFVQNVKNARAKFYTCIYKFIKLKSRQQADAKQKDFLQTLLI